MPGLPTSEAQLESLRACLLNTGTPFPLHERFRALFTLKAIGGEDAVRIIAEGFKDESPLLKHELAYVLGQIGEMSAVPHLEAVLRDEENRQGEMVRHEAAEALGALSSTSSLPLLRQYIPESAEPSRSVRETCEIAVAKIEWENSEEGKKEVAERGLRDPNFPTIDPATAHASTDLSIPQLLTDLLNPKLPLFERYRAMFSLRNLAGPFPDGRARPEADIKQAVEALARGFADGSALFRHEIAYIFGQLSSPYSVPSLLRVLRDANEDDMVRHEAAEALGGIASDGEELPGAVDFDDQADKEKGVLQILRDWSVKEDAPMVVRESCQVAVDMWEYENSNQFQYADGLSAEAPKDTAAGPRLTGMDRGVVMA